jgi:hypothetical protein
MPEDFDPSGLTGQVLNIHVENVLNYIEKILTSAAA